MPWLLLPPPESPSFSNNDYIIFFSLSDTKVHTLTLPRAFGEGWVHGSSKGWLIMVKGAYSKMFLLNPISGALQKLPSLRSVSPEFTAFKELKKQLDTEVLDNCNRVVLSTSDIFSEDFMVAVYRDRILAVCRPGDKRWKKILEFEQSADTPKLCEILFSSGVLYALVNGGENNDLDVAARAKMFTGNKVEVKFVNDRDPRPIRISVYKLDGESNYFFELENLGNQIIFWSGFESISLASGMFEGNCICFTTSKSAGVFYLSSGSIEQIGNSLAVSGNHESCWFTPNL